MKKPVQFGKYLLLDRINVGGMAEVFKAKAFGVEGFERLVAVKRILPNIAEDNEFIEMFIDEAKIAVQLSHANIAQIFDLGKAEESYFIALEFVQGKDLRSIFDRCKLKVVDGSPAMPLGQACFIIMKACEGLDYAHNKKEQSGTEINLVHRDVSPQNILISYEGEVKLIDFGIAKAAGKANKTQQGILKGKFGYMSPEQVRGLPLDRRSDIFSVGICLYELLTAERLFVGESDFSTLEKVRNVEILPPSTYNRRIPEELERIVLKALAKDVEDRYQNAIDLHDDLQAFMYTAGEFYARKDLGAWMKRVYDEEIRQEQKSIESYQRLPALNPPPVTPTPGTQLPSASQLATQQPQGDRPRRPSGQMAAAPPPPPAQAIQQRPSQQMPAVPPPRPPELSSKQTTALGSAVEPAPKNGKHANGHANGHKNGAHAADLNWDDEELATNIYDDKAEDADDSIVSDQPAAVRPDLSRVELSADGLPVPASPRAPTPNRGVPPIATRLPSQNFGAGLADTRSGGSRRRGGPPMALLFAVGGVMLIAIVVVGSYLWLANRPGKLQLAAEPSTGLQVFIDNQRVPNESTPATISRAAGTYSLTVQHEGYVPFTETVELKSGQTFDKHVTLEPYTSGTGFKLAEPIGAQVFLDGKQLDGQTPLQVQSVMPGKHKVEVRGTYGSWIEDVQLEAGKMTELHPVFPAAPPIALAPPSHIERSDHTTRIERGDHTTPPPVNLSSPDRPERAPVERPERVARNVDPPLDPPVRRAPVVRDDPPARPAQRRPRTAAAPEESDDPPAPAPRASNQASSGETGYLRIGSKPWAKINIDGKDTGMNTPQTQIKLSAGAHRIVLFNPTQNLREAFSVTITAGQTETIRKDLGPKDTQSDD